MRRVIVLLLDQRQDSDSEGGESAQWEEVWDICMERVKCEISLTSYYHFNQSEGDLSPNNNSLNIIISLLILALYIYGQKTVFDILI